MSQATTPRIEVFKQILESDPGNSNVLFGLAKEYEKAGEDGQVIEVLDRYLASADDEGNAYGMLAAAYERTGQRDQAKQTYERGIAVASSHGHPSMAEEYRNILATEFPDSSPE